MVAQKIKKYCLIAGQLSSRNGGEKINHRPADIADHAEARRGQWRDFTYQFDRYFYAFVTRDRDRYAGPTVLQSGGFNDLHVFHSVLAAPVKLIKLLSPNHCNLSAGK